MADQPRIRKNRKSLERSRRIDTLCDRFEARIREGDRPRIEDFLEQVPVEEREALEKELRKLEIELTNRSRGDPAEDADRSESSNPSSRASSSPLDETAADSASRANSCAETELFVDSMSDPATADTLAYGEARSSMERDRASRGGTHYKIGRFLLVERLGFGSQGDVWRAIQLEPIVRTAAMKLLPLGTDLDDERVERLRKEAERAGRIGHASIPAIYEFGTANGRTYLAMQLINGYSLAAVIGQRRSRLEGKPPANLHRLAILPEKEYLKAVAGLISKTARALAEVHQSRLAHRDIKPANLLLDREHEDRVYLADFGLARDLDQVSGRPDVLSGTLIYMAPEKLLGHSGADEIRADLYSLGVSLFEAITLQRPFLVPEDLTAIAKARYLATTEPRRPRDLRPSLPKDLEAIVLTATDRRPESRYKSANEFADDLDRWHRGEPVRARPPGMGRKIGRALIRRRAELAVAAVLLTIASSFVVARRIILDAEARRSRQRQDLAVKFRRSAESLLQFGEIDAAWRDYDRAKQLAPNDPALNPLGLKITQRLLADLQESNEMDDPIRSRHLYRLWREAQSGPPNRIRMIRTAFGILDLEVVSEPSGARVVFRATHRDGRPKDVVVYETVAGSPGKPAILPEFVPGYYWITAYAPDGGFAERSCRFGDLSRLQGNRPRLMVFPKKRGVRLPGMVRVPGGSFRMGLDRDAKLPDGATVPYDSTPEHLVQVPTFDLDETETTRGAFRLWFEKTDALNSIQKEGFRKALNFDRLLRPEFDDLPMTGLPYRLAVEYAAEAGCRLPTEEELEWAGRGPDGRLLPPNVPRDWRPDLADEWKTTHPVRSVPLDRVDFADGSPIFGLFGNAGEMTMFRWRVYPNQNGVRPLLWGVFPGIVVRSGIINSFSGEQARQLGYIGRAILPGDEVHPLVGFRRARSLVPLMEDSSRSSRPDAQ